MPETAKIPAASHAAVRRQPLPLEFPGVHHMDSREIEAAVRVLRARSPFRYYGIDLQHETEQLEAEITRSAGVNYALAVSSGTGALHTALAALGVGPGQEIIVPAYLWVSIAAAVVNLGAVPVVADIDDTFCLDPAGVERRITPHTRGIILAHMSGAPGDAAAVRDIARRKGLFLLEDCAQCVGGAIDGRSVGTFGDMAIFSFQMNKTITAGEGGCVLTGDRDLYRKAVAGHDLGYPRDDDGRLVMDDPAASWGRGYRMDELRAAVLRVQLTRLPVITGAMRRSKYRIRAALERLGNVRLRRILDPAGDTGSFLITTYDHPQTAAEVHRGLLAEGIATWPQGISNVLMTGFGLHLYYNNVSLVERRGLAWKLAENRGLGRDSSKGACPYADSLFERSIVIAVPSCLTPKDEDDIIEAFEKVLAARR